MSPRRRIPSQVHGHAFTLVEMIMVIALISLLAAIAITIGGSMADSGRAHATQGVLQLLDQTLEDYIENSGANPPPLVAIVLDEDIATNTQGQIVYYPVIDGRFDRVIPGSSPAQHYEVNSIGLFLHSIKDSSDVDGLLSQIDNNFVRIHDVPDDLQPGMLTIFDAWGNPIRFVHPKFDGIIESARRPLADPGAFLDVTDLSLGYFTAVYLPDNNALIPFSEVRRNRILPIDRIDAPQIETDSDGGLCPAQRPYFYSAGPDGDPATIKDNLYTILPQFVDPL